MGFFYGIQHPFARLQGKQSSSKKEVGHFHLLFNNLLAVRAYKQDYGVLKYFTCFFSHFSS